MPAAAEPAVEAWTGAVRTVEAFEAHIGRYGLSPGRFAVLLTLLAADRHTMLPSEIADRIGVTRPTVTNLVTGLVGKRLVDRSSDAGDRRNQPIVLTERGHELIAAAAADHFRRLAAVMAAFTDAERETLHQANALFGRLGDRLTVDLPGEPDENGDRW